MPNSQLQLLMLVKARIESVVLQEVYCSWVCNPFQSTLWRVALSSSSTSIYLCSLHPFYCKWSYYGHNQEQQQWWAVIVDSSAYGPGTYCTPSSQRNNLISYSISRHQDDASPYRLFQFYTTDYIHVHIHLVSTIVIDIFYWLHELSSSFPALSMNYKIELMQAVRRTLVQPECQSVTCTTDPNFLVHEH